MITADTLSDSDRSAISAGLDRWLTAFHAADVGALVADVAADVMVFPPNQPSVIGAAALRRWHEDQLKEADTALNNVKTEEILGGSMLAVQRFSYAFRVQPRTGGAVIEDHGICFWIWQRESSGRWVVARAIWNSSTAFA